MSYNTTLRDRFTDGALHTISGPKVVVLAYDRMDRDLAGVLDALAANDLAMSHELLVHTQDIVHELQCMLDLEVWEHAPALAEIYRYVIELLTNANVTKSAGPALAARRHLAELGDAFRQAAAQAPAASTIPMEPDQQRRISVRA